VTLDLLIASVVSKADYLLSGLVIVMVGDIGNMLSQHTVC